MASVEGIVDRLQIVIWELNDVGDSSRTVHPSYTSSPKASDNAPIADLKWLPGHSMARNGALVSTEVHLSSSLSAHSSAA